MNPEGAILVVEDDLDCRSVLTDLLELAGYSVVPCSDAAAALASAREKAPSLLLVDLHLPGRDGAWLIRALRDEGGALARLPIVLTTGSPDARGIAQELGVRALEKPFDASRLLDLIATLVPARPAASK